MMRELDPIHQQCDDVGASLIPFGSEDQAVPVVEGFDALELEYAAIRKGVGVMLTPQLAAITLTGPDRDSFLQSLVTQDLTKVQSGQARRTFVLNEKGRIVADAMAMRLDERWVLLTSRFVAKALCELLDSKLFMEEVTIADQSQQFACIALHGPASFDLMHAAELGGDQVSQLTDGDVCEFSLVEAAESAANADDADQTCVVMRRDETGALGLHLLVPATVVLKVWSTLVDKAGGLIPDVDGGMRREIAGRGLGWSAYNTARIEAGTLLYHIDFGPDTLPHETGLMDEAVSLTKGCYVGQEIVARMQNLGQPKRVLVAVKFDGNELPPAGAAVHAAPSHAGDVDMADVHAAPGHEGEVHGRDIAQPPTQTDPARGDAIHRAIEKPEDAKAASQQITPSVQDSNSADGPATDDPPRAEPHALGPAIGAVTSSTMSPMLGGVPVAMVMLRYADRQPGNTLAVRCPGGKVAMGQVQAQRRFL